MQDFKLQPMKMKRACRIAAFFLLLVFMILGLSRMLTNASSKDDNMIANRNKNIIKIQKERKDSLDAVIIGDSLSYSSFSPIQMWREQGFASFVCGQSGQKIQETYYMLKTVFENQSPKVVVIETGVLFRAQVGLNGLKESFVEKSNYYMPVFRYHDVWKPVLFGKKYVEESFKGFIIRDTVGSYDGGTYMKPTEDKIPITDMVKDYMNKIITLCEENNAKICLVSAPSPANYNYQKHNSIAEYAAEKGMQYVDLNLMTEELGIDWKSDSQDKGDHLNLSGARKVSAFVGDCMKENYQLADHRKDKAYQDWRIEAESYKVREAEVMDIISKK